MSKVFIISMKSRKSLLVILLLVFAYGNLFGQQPQKVDIQSGFFEKRPELPDAVIYTKERNSQVHIVHEGIEMWCDQALVYMQENFVKAYGNVLISQGDTLTMHSKYAEYNGDTQFAFASGNVILREPQSTLTTDTLYFNRIKQQAFYRTGGTVVDTASVLTSQIGRYFVEEKKYQFLQNVVLVNPNYTINSPQLDFYTENGYAYLYGPSTIEGESSTVFCDRGFYDTRNDFGHFMQNARVDYDSRTVYGDSIFFDRFSNFASASNNVEVIDTINNSIARGHYAEVFKDKDSLFLTKRAVAISVSQGDSTYVHADTLRITGKENNRIMKGFYDVRIYKSDMSGKCDSIFVDENTGITKMITRPVLWTEDSQMTGDTIHLLSNTVTEKLDTLKVFYNAFLIQQDSIGYNQVKGMTLTGLFHDNELDTINIDRNAEVIFYTRNDKQELIGINHTLSSSLQISMEDDEIETIRFINKVDGKLHPEEEFPPNARILRGFNWRGDERLTSVDDLFKGKPAPVLPKITGIPLPKFEEDFFDDLPEEEVKLPKASELEAKDLQNDPDAVKPLYNEEVKNNSVQSNMQF